MATTLINYTLSTTTAAAAFSIAAGDTLVVTRAGTVAGLTPAGDGVTFAGAGELFNAGHVHGSSIAIYGGGGTGSREIANLEGGIVTAGGTAISVFSGSGHRIENDGQISADSQGVTAGGGGSAVRNAGTISAASAIGLSGDGNTLTNTGEIFARFGAVDATGNNNALFNAGLISVQSEGYARGILMGQSGNKITNTGTIRIEGTSGQGDAIKFGFSSGDTGTLDNVIENSGSILVSGLRFAIFGDENTEIVRNSGLIVGDTVLFAGNDLFDGTLGRQGAVFGGSGNDVLLGGAFADTFRGDDGTDSLVGGGGDDILAGGAGADTLEGGDGRDLLDYRASSAAVEVSLLLGTGTGGDAAGDVFSGFEWLSGGAAADALTGDKADNRVFGGGGADVLNGGLGTDTLLGGDGDDFLIGGTGADVLTGGAGSDRFRYTAVADSAGAVRDVITDFAAGDRLDLAVIDANAAGGTANDAFVFVSSAAFTAVGQVRAVIIGDNTYVSANTDANLATSEMTIVLRGAITLAASDFVL